jgi:FkbM family methyltransferase
MNPYAREILRNLDDGATIFEFGAHRAEDTLEIAACGFGRFYAFEPDPRNLEIIRKSGLPPGVTLIPKAVGERAGRTILYQSTNIVENFGVWTASSSIHRPLSSLPVGSNLRFENSVEVDVVSLDDFCKAEQIDKIDFIWADIQGAERDMVKGGAKMIPLTHYFFMEHEKVKTYEDQWSFEEMMASLPDFEVLEIFPNDVLLVNKNWLKK